ncbi:MAG: secondary thiamine-phosphate synthase enzyme YjbQ [Thermodesulfobacteriota bacterium]
MRELIEISTKNREELVDITLQVKKAVKRSGVTNGVVCLYAQGATAAIMIQENWDDSIRLDVVDCMRKLVPQGVWLHDRQDGNGDAHIKAGIIGPSEVIPIMDGEVGLSTWQNIFFCDFDGPREKRTIVVTIMKDAA